MGTTAASPRLSPETCASARASGTSALAIPSSAGDPLRLQGKTPKEDGPSRPFAGWVASLHAARKSGSAPGQRIRARPAWSNHPAAGTLSLATEDRDKHPRCPHTDRSAVLPLERTAGELLRLDLHGVHVQVIAERPLPKAYRVSLQGGVGELHRPAGGVERGGPLLAQAAHPPRWRQSSGWSRGSADGCAAIGTRPAAAGTTGP